jgi:hypothetical protein
MKNLESYKVSRAMLATWTNRMEADAQLQLLTSMLATHLAPHKLMDPVMAPHNLMDPVMAPLTLLDPVITREKMVGIIRQVGMAVHMQDMIIIHILG